MNYRHKHNIFLLISCLLVRHGELHIFDERSDPWLVVGWSNKNLMVEKKIFGQLTSLLSHPAVIDLPSSGIIIIMFNTTLIIIIIIIITRH